ncbi:MAG: hypothetical protein GEU28_08930 [Dehalococcoidia bacterium]|nr:hypothetical protein [Dehalococcoidia bacterium]
MNWVDAFVVGLLMLYMGVGLVQGFVQRVLFSIVFLVSLAVSFVFYPEAAALLEPVVPDGWEKAAGFLLLFFAVDVLGGIVASRILLTVPRSVLEAPLNRVAGVLPSALNGLVLLSFLLTFVITMPASPKVKEDILASRYGSLLVDQSRAAEGRLADIFGEPINATLTFLTTIRPSSTDPADTIDLGFQTTAVSIDPEAEMEMLRLLNEERTSRGLPPLASDGGLQGVARGHSTDMFARGYFAHVNPDGLDPFDRMRLANVSFAIAGENLAYAPAVQVAHDGLMNSPGHRANILSSEFCRIGVGVIDGGIYGKMFSQEFSCQ